MITCYLDSQDYSALTDPKAATPDRRAIREALLGYARSGQIRFAFSAAAVCEAVALTPDAAHLAELKAEFLSDLCGSNALMSFDRLMHAEVLALVSGSGRPEHMFDPQGRWFPDIPIEDGVLSPWEKMRAAAEEEMTAMGLSRQQRRAAARKLIKNGKPRPIFQAHLDRQDPRVHVAEVIKQFPMSPEYAEVMARYALGRASEEDFMGALTGSLLDPRWMMKWFTTRHAISSPIAEIVRKPGRDLGHTMRNLAEVSKRWAAALRDSGMDKDPTGRNGEIARRWSEMQDQQLVRLAQRFAGESEVLGVGNFTASDVDAHCPGLSAGFRSLFSSVWENVGGSRKELPTDSQPVDALHAFYAPYVNVFRADRFMAPHIQKQVAKHETVVVPRLAQLVDVLENQLRRTA